MNKISIHFLLFSIAIIVGALNLMVLLKLMNLYRKPSDIVLNCNTNTLIEAGEAFKDGLLKQNEYNPKNKKEPLKKTNKSSVAQKTTYKKSNNQTKKSVENQKVGESAKIP